MKQKNLAYFNSAFMGVTLFITLFLISRFNGINILYLGLGWIGLNGIKDIILYKKGFTFANSGIRPMVIVNILSLISLIIFYFTLI